MKISPIWKLGLEQALAILDNQKLDDAGKLAAVQNTVLYSVNSTDREEQKASALLWDGILMERHGADWQNRVPQESEFYRADMTFLYDGRRASQDWFKKCNLALTCLNFNPGHVLELGAGFGQVGRLMMMARPFLKYTIIDLPETMHFAMLFLRLSFPDKVIVWATCTKDFTAPCDIRLIPADLASAYATSGAPQADVFLNSSSLGEMDRSYQEFYIGLIQNNIRPRYAVLLNRLFNTYDPVVEAYRENEAAWYWALDNRWDVLQWELEPDFTTIPYEAEMYHNREVFIVARRAEEKVLAEDVHFYRNHYWFKNFSLRASDRCANQLRFDHETLMRLCENARVMQSAESLDALLKFLFTIRKRFPFEEEAMLHKFYRQIAGQQHPLSSSLLSRARTKLLAGIVKPMKHLPEPVKAVLRLAYNT